MIIYSLGELVNSELCLNVWIIHIHYLTLVNYIDSISFYIGGVNFFLKAKIICLLFWVSCITKLLNGFGY